MAVVCEVGIRAVRSNGVSLEVVKGAANILTIPELGGVGVEIFPGLDIS
jgi:hypothetical protein